tara:strand:+ start:6986 stop:7153 length:168 start_codon:yes stop_codon:yes gene_type:complete
MQTNADLQKRIQNLERLVKTMCAHLGINAMGLEGKNDPHQQTLVPKAQRTLRDDY